MMTTTTLATLLLGSIATTTTTALANPLSKRLIETDGYYNPTENGGRWLTVRPTPLFPLLSLFTND